MSKRVMIYCDGAITGNGKPGSVGGWAAVLLWEKEKGLYAVREVGGAAVETTNNRMEMQGPLEGIAAVPDVAVPITVLSDSQYVIKGASVWLHKWLRGGHKVPPGLSNADLWQKVHNLKLRRHDLTWEWVRGHNGDFWNERADKIATDMVKRAQAEGHAVRHDARYWKKGEAPPRGVSYEF